MVYIIFRKYGCEQNVLSATIAGIIHKDLYIVGKIVPLTREANVATQLSAISVEEVADSGRAFQSLLLCGKKLPLEISVQAVVLLSGDFFHSH